MAVKNPDEFKQYITDSENERIKAFSQNPGYGGQRVRIKRGYDKETVDHVTFGAGYNSMALFYRRSGDDFELVGIGRHEKKIGGKVAYNALWERCGGYRQQVVILGMT